MKNSTLYNVPRLALTKLSPEPFEIFKLRSNTQIIDTSNRQGVYKVYLITGSSIVHCANQKIHAHGTNLFFSNADTRYSWQFISEKQNGYACLLTSDFLKKFDYLNVFQQSYLFGTDKTLVFPLNNMQKNFIASIFCKITAELNTSYLFKDELVHNWLSLMMHEAIKIKTATPLSYIKHQNV